MSRQGFSENQDFGTLKVKPGLSRRCLRTVGILVLIVAGVVGFVWVALS